MQNSNKMRPKSPAARNPYMDTPTSVFVHNGEFSTKQGSGGRDGRFPSRKNVSLHPIGGSKSGLSPQNSLNFTGDHGHEQPVLTPKTDSGLGSSNSNNERLRMQLSALLKLQSSQREMIINIMEELSSSNSSVGLPSNTFEDKANSGDHPQKKGNSEHNGQIGSRHTSPAIIANDSSLKREETPSRSKRGQAIPKGKKDLKGNTGQIAASQTMETDVSDESDFDFAGCFAALSQSIVPCSLDLKKFVPTLQLKLAQLLNAESVVFNFKTEKHQIINNPFQPDRGDISGSSSNSTSISSERLSSTSIYSFKKQKDDFEDFKSLYNPSVDGGNIPAVNVNNLVAIPFSQDIAPAFSAYFTAVCVFVNLPETRFSKMVSYILESVLSYVSVHISTFLALHENKAEPEAPKTPTSTLNAGASSIPSTNLSQIRDFTSMEEVDQYIGSILMHACALTMSEKCVFFRLNEQRDSWISNTFLGANKTIAIPKDTGIEGQVLRTGEAVIVSDAMSDPRTAKHELSDSGFKLLNVLCIPVTVDQHVIGVVELLNKRNSLFTGKDIRTLSIFSTLCGLVMRNYSLNMKSHRLEHTIEAFLGASNTFRSGNDVASMVRAIMSQAQDVVNADRFAVFEVDRMNKEIRSKFSIGMDDIIVPMGKGIVGHVVSSEEPVIVEEVSLDSRFYGEIDRQSGYRTRDVMCVPIFNKVSDLIGVVEMVNKRSECPFDKGDLEVLKAFISFLSMSLTNLSDLNNAFAMEDTRLKGSLDYFEKRYRVPQKAKDTIANIYFQCWEYSVDEIVGLFVHMFEDLGFIKKYKIDKLKLFNFLLKCQSLYRSDVPYHNFVHAFDVTHCTYLFYKYCDIFQYLTEIEVFGLFVACVCHDLDHRGFNNAFQVKMKSPIALLYNNVAVMENHHCATAVTILSIPENNILEGLSETEYGEVWQVIISSILATDMASHFEYVSKIQKVAQEKSYTKDSEDHRKLFANILIKCSDISNIAKPFPLAKHWADVVTIEFFNQGDAEKKYNLPVTPIMDRDKVVLPQMQMGFIGAIGVPIFSHLADVAPGLSIFRDCTVDNKEQWNLILQEMQKGQPA